ncbi:MAG TPA: DinB family protein [Mycobacteriales bacterium]|nr:DinB family protein [Mycobacteriales bacterium]
MADWTAPAVARTEADLRAGERKALEQWLDYHRGTLLHKCSGLSHDQLKQRSVPTSALTLLGIVRHMADVERWWFRMHGAGEQLDLQFSSDEWPNGDFEDLDAMPAAEVLATFEAECAASRAAVADKDLDVVVTCGPEHHHRSHERDVRWLFVHMIEEYARHNGHADLLREAIDGATGE